MRSEQIIESLLSRGILIEPGALELIRSQPGVASSLKNVRAEYITAELVKRMAALKEIESSSELKTDLSFRITSEYFEDFAERGKTDDFLTYFHSRYETIASMMRNRRELRDLMSANRIAKLPPRENVSLIGMVTSKHNTAKGHIILDIEDTTGGVRVLVGKNSSCFEDGDEIVVDEVVGIRGQTGDGIVFANSVTFPDIPLENPFPRSEGYAVFTSDWHIGSNKFLEKEFMAFLEFLKSGEGIAPHIKNIFLAGDVVDGVGIYKGQNDELLINDVEQQYARVAELLKLIPKHINIFISPGNHDATREAEPQPAIPKEFAPELYSLSNVFMTSSPCMVKVGEMKVMMYHGGGLISLIDSIPKLRKIGHDQPDQTMIMQLKKRHLVPIYGENTHIFPEGRDHMVIETIPNVLHSGHLHSVGLSTYRGVRVINSGTFQDITPFQMKLGNHPVPAKVPYLNLSTGGMGLLDFGGGG